MRKILMVIVLLLITGSYVPAQEAILSSGSYDSDPDVGSISWSLGETVTNTLKKGDIILTQGFQQPVLTITEINRIAEINYNISAFPNPAKEYISVQINTDSFENMIVELYDFKGIKIKQKPIESNIMQLSLLNMNAGVYVIRIIDNNIAVKTFKIIKQ